MKKIFYILTIINFVGLGYLASQSNPSFGGVRGGQRTGFTVMAGDNFTIGTSSEPLADVHVYNSTASTSVAIDGGVIGCLVIRNKAVGVLDYWISNAAGWATTTAANCGL